MTMQDLGTDQDKLCADLFDPECSGVAVPEQDGDLRYYACSVCGYEGGYFKINLPTFQDKDSCDTGVPEDVRRAYSAPMEAALAKAAKADPVPLTLGVRRS